MNPLPEKELIKLSQEGNREAFDNLLNDNIPKLKNYLFKNFKLNKMNLEDVVQNSILKCWNKIGSFKSESSFFTWLATIAKNESINFLNVEAKKLQTEVPVSQISETNNIDCRLDETAESILMKKEELKIYNKVVNEVLEKLPKKQNELLRIVFETNKSYSEIASMLHIPVGTIMSRAFHARKNFRNILFRGKYINELQHTNLGRF